MKGFAVLITALILVVVAAVSLAVVEVHSAIATHHKMCQPAFGRNPYPC
jgi:hypothetical protein